MKKEKKKKPTKQPQTQQQYYTQYIMLYSDINNINNIEYSEQKISRMDKWYINDQRKQTQHNIILVFNKLKQEQICTAHIRCNENQNCRQFQCFIYMQQCMVFTTDLPELLSTPICSEFQTGSMSLNAGPIQPDSWQSWSETL